MNKYNYLVKTILFHFYVECCEKLSKTSERKYADQISKVILIDLKNVNT